MKCERCKEEKEKLYDLKVDELEYKVCFDCADDLKLILMDWIREKIDYGMINEWRMEDIMRTSACSHRIRGGGKITTYQGRKGEK
jgi:hypothetical protein